ncbi:MAG: class I SAM-dependent methyltransferase [Anaerolineales bacterium]|nr:class I SAM-dependent methyltransferase [Anaerolineales bacterium]
MIWLYLLPALLLLAAFLYWGLVITEGVYFGRRLVVWLYDLTAPKYEGIKEFNELAERFFIAQPLLQLMDDYASLRVLDVAAGTGRVARSFYLEGDAFAGQIISLEASGPMLAVGRDLADRPDTHWLQALAEPLPFADAQFEIVTCLEALEFLPSQEKALAEMVRVLRPDGVLLTTRRKGWEAHTFIGRYYSEARFVELLQGLGLINVMVQPWQFDYELVFAIKPPEE